MAKHADDSSAAGSSVLPFPDRVGAVRLEALHSCLEEEVAAHEAASELLAKLFKHDRRSWMLRVPKSRIVNSPAMVRRLAFIARAPHSSIRPESLQILDIAEAIAESNLYRLDMRESLMHVCISRANLLLERRDQHGALAALLEAERSAPEGLNGDCERGKICAWKARLYASMRKYREALCALTEAYRFSSDDRIEELREMLDEIVSAMEREARL